MSFRQTESCDILCVEGLGIEITLNLVQQHNHCTVSLMHRTLSAHKPASLALHYHAVPSVPTLADAAISVVS